MPNQSRSSTRGPHRGGPLISPVPARTRSPAGAAARVRGEGWFRGLAGCRVGAWHLLLLVTAWSMETGRGASLQWTNTAGGTWGVASNWSPNQVPGPEDTVTIAAAGGYTVVADATATVQSLTLGGAAGLQTLSIQGALTMSAGGMIGAKATLALGGTLNVGGPLVVSGVLEWASGSLRGPVQVDLGGRLLLAGPGVHESEGSITNAGSIDWKGGQWYLENGMTLVNAAGGVFLLDSEISMSRFGSEPNRLINEGTLRRESAGAGRVEVDFENRGLVEVREGILRFPAGFVSRGKFEVGASGRLELEGGTFELAPGHGFAGDGFYGSAGGSIEVKGDLAAPNFQVVGGRYSGTNRITGKVRWSGGTVVGAWTVAPGGELILDGGGGGAQEYVGNLANEGTVRWSEGQFYLEHESTFLNRAGALFLIEGDLPLNPFGASPNRLINEGTIRKTGGAGASQIRVDFRNAGLVEVLAGTVEFPAGFVSSGRFEVAAGARLEMTGGGFEFLTGNVFGGEGFYGTVGGSILTAGELVGTNFRLAGGNVSGTNQILGKVRWSGGKVAGSWRVVPGAELILEEAGEHEYVGNLTNEGTVRWLGGRFYLEEQSRFRNRVGGLFLIEGDSPLSPFGPSPNTLVNDGTMRKVGGAGVSQIRVDFQNSGLVEVLTGTIEFPEGFVSRGRFEVATGARLELTGGAFEFQPGNAFSGGGFYGVTGGSIVTSGDLVAPDFRVAGEELRGTNRISGGFRWLGGRLKGQIEVLPGSTFEIRSNGSMEFLGTLLNSGRLEWSQGRFFVQDGTELRNEAGGLFLIESDASLAPAGNGPVQMINRGILRKTGSAGVTEVSVPLDNEGRIELRSGTFRMTKALTQTAGGVVLDGGTLESIVPVDLRGGALSGNGLVLGTVQNAGEVSPGLSPGRLEIRGDYSQLAGGVMSIELAGRNPEDYDRLVVGGTASLNGLLRTTFLGGFVPPTNSAYPFFRAAVREGIFARHDYPTNQVAFDLRYEGAAATLQVLRILTNVSQFPPVLDPIVDPSVNEQEPLALTIHATDADIPANRLTYRLDAGPPGASIDPATGVLTWTPDETQGPGAVPFTVRVSDNGGLSDSKTFTVRVREVNLTPVLEPVPLQVAAPGTTVRFSAVASDPDIPVQPLRFSLVGAPAGAGIHPETGAFSWPVPASQAGGVVRFRVRVVDDAVPPAGVEVEVAVQVDRAGPRVVAVSPSGVVSNVVDHLDVTWDSPIDISSVDATDLRLDGPSGQVPVTVQLLSAESVRVGFAALRPGEYVLRVGPGISDVSGNLMNQDGDGVNGEPGQDQFTAEISVRLPDLGVVEIRAPAFARQGEPVSLSWVVTNRGNVAAAGPWRETLSLAGAPALLTLVVSNTLSAGVAQARTQTVVLPPGGLAGDVRFRVELDTFGEVPESDELNNAAESSTITKVPVQLALRWDETAIAEGDPRGGFVATVLRNGSLDQPLVVSLASSLPSELKVPAAVIIPAGQFSVAFEAVVQADGVVDGPKVVEIVATAAGLETARRRVTVIDSDRPHLLLSANPPVVREGLPLSIEIRRDVVTSFDQSVTLGLSDDLQATLPGSVVIPANAPSVTVTLRTLEDTLIEGPRILVVTATADGMISGSLEVRLTDDDLPELSVEVNPAEVLEGAVSGAVTGWVRRSEPGPREVTVALTSSRPELVRVPAAVVLPAGELRVPFPVVTVDNPAVDGVRKVSIGVRAVDSLSGEPLDAGIPGSLDVLDDDGPTLALALDRTLAGEGLDPAATVTLSRRPAGGAALTVAMESSHGAKLVVPVTVTIPAGAGSVSFPVRTLKDSVADGDVPVTLRASASGWTRASAVLVVTDRPVPDLVVASLVAPVTAVTGGTVEIAARTENRGYGATGGAFVQRVLLSTDPVPGDDTLLNQVEFTTPVLPGGFLDQKVLAPVPEVPGTYWVIVETDVGDAVEEAIEGNNSAVSASPIVVEPAYTATVRVAVGTAVMGTPVPFEGEARLAGGGRGAGAVPVRIHIRTRGTERLMTVLTGSDGRFSGVFTPLPEEAGSYEVAAAHPGVVESPTQARFTLVGMRLIPAESSMRVAEGAAVTNRVRIENLSDVPLEGIQASVVEAPPGTAVRVDLEKTSIPGQGEGGLNVRVTAALGAVLSGDVGVRVGSAGGVGVTLFIPLTVQALRPRLVAEPGRLVTGMTRGVPSSVVVRIANTGGASSRALNVLVPALPWLAVGSAATLPPLAPGASSEVTFRVTPPMDLALGDHEGAMVVTDGDVQVTVPFTFRCLSDAIGALRVSAVDEFTYYAEGSPPVAGARVVLTDELTGQVVATGLTDARGELQFQNVREAYYRLVVSAEGHGSHRSTVRIKAGETEPVLAFLNRELVTYQWKVVPTEIEDRTRIVIESVFETVVPFPVVTVEPMVIDLADVHGEQAQVMVTITNHGLVAAEDVELRFEEHPNFRVTPLAGRLGRLGARSSVTVPLVIRRLVPAAAAAGAARLAGAGGGGGGACDMSGVTLYNAICGPVKRNYAVPMLLANAGKGCGGSGGTPDGGAFIGSQRLGGGGGTGFEGGGTSQTPYTAPLHVDEKTPCNLCPLKRIGTAVGCAFPIVREIFKNHGDVLERDPFLARIIDGIEKIKDAKEKFDKVFGKSPEPGSSPNRGGQMAGVEIPLNDINIGTIIEATQDALEHLVEHGTEAGKAAAKRYLSYINIIGCIYDVATACDGASAAGSSGGVAGSARGGRMAATIGDVTRPELAALRRHAARMQKLVDLDLHLMGGEPMLRDETPQGPDWLRAFLEGAGASTPDGALISVTERAALMALAPPSTAQPGDVTRFIDRWNRSVAYWKVGRFDVTQVPKGEETDFIDLVVLRRILDEILGAYEASVAEGFTSISDGVEAARLDLIRFDKSVLQTGGGGGADEGGECATVRLRIEQQAVITRDAFEATLEVGNATGGPLEDFGVELEVRDASGRVMTERFGIRPPELAGVGAVDGSGVVSPGGTARVRWILIPGSDAAPEGPVVMFVGGRLRYRQGGVLVEIPLSPAGIEVLPNASLVVKYFHQRDVFSDDPFTEEIEPAIPYSLGVLIRNNGKGAARNVRISSAQPTIVENEKGLLIDFEILATEVGGNAATTGLTAAFGDIGPGEVAEGRWLLRSSLQGLFIDYKASFEHLDGMGDRRLSLIEGVEIHELNHVVRADRGFEDGKPDFLANDVPDLDDLPDTLHLSDGRIEAVNLVTNAVVDAAVGPGHLEVRLQAAVPPGWTYLRVPNPGGRDFRLMRVLRPDGTEVRPEFNVWTTDRTFIGHGRKPIREDILHLLDHGGGGVYTLAFAPAGVGDTVAPVSRIEALPAASYRSIPVRWSGDDGAGGSGIESFEVSVSIDGGAFLPWLRKTTHLGALYEGEAGTRYAFQVRATDRAGNVEAAHPGPDAETEVTLSNTAPTLAGPSEVRVREGETVAVEWVGVDADRPADVLTFSLAPGAPAGMVIDPSTGVLTWVTGEGSGPGTNRVEVRVVDNGSPPMGASHALTVVVEEVNQPPVVAEAPVQRVREGSLLTVAMSGSDPDLPPNALTFTLGPGAPQGAAISPAGVFTWRPTAAQGPSSNAIAIIATDRGLPPMSATQTLAVVVRDALGDFAVELGATHVRAGEGGSVPLSLAPGSELNRLILTLGIPGALTGPELVVAGAGVASALMQPLGGERFQVVLESAPASILPPGVLAQLRFGTRPRVSGAFPVPVTSAVGRRGDGVLLDRATARDGKVIVIGDHPVLEVAREPAPLLKLYGSPGTRYVIDSSDTVGPAALWLPWLSRLAVSEVEVIGDLPAATGIRFYRARASTSEAPVLELRQETGGVLRLLVRGRAGGSFDIEGADTPGGAVLWSVRDRVTIPAAGVAEWVVPVDGRRTGYFRVRERQP